MLFPRYRVLCYGAHSICGHCNIYPWGLVRGHVPLNNVGGAAQSLPLRSRQMPICLLVCCGLASRPVSLMRRQIHLCLLMGRPAGRTLLMCCDGWPAGQTLLICVMVGQRARPCLYAVMVVQRASPAYMLWVVQRASPCLHAVGCPAGQSHRQMSICPVTCGVGVLGACLPKWSSAADME